MQTDDDRSVSKKNEITKTKQNLFLSYTDEIYVY